MRNSDLIIEQLERVDLETLQDIVELEIIQGLR
jgi:hypothetical protein